ncbi:MAG: NADH-quinone oxidoreductase subunit J [Terriglobia bacterium]|nr:NADH-quinone oxidoreductase subunit J [Terriglobia bacterium]
MTVTFLILAALTLAGTVAAMAMRNLIHCVLALTLGFAGLAALYLLLGAQFVGFTQILVYVGAVAILAVFVIMMTQSAIPAMQSIFSSFWVAGSVVAVAVFAVLAWAICRSGFASQVLPPVEAAVHPIGDALMHGYVLPLEIMGLLLTAAMIGAVVLAMHEKRRTP